MNIKPSKPKLLYGRAPLFMSARNSDDAKNLRYQKYQILFNHYYPHCIYETNASRHIVQTLPIIEDTALKPSKIKWYEIVPNWIVELFTRDKSNQEILSGTA